MVVVAGEKKLAREECGGFPLVQPYTYSYL